MSTTKDHKEFGPSTSSLHSTSPTVGAADPHTASSEDQEPSASTLRDENGAMAPKFYTAQHLTESDTEDTDTLFQSDTNDTDTLVQSDTDDTDTLGHSDSDDTDTPPLTPTTTEARMVNTTFQAPPALEG